MQYYSEALNKPLFSTPVHAGQAPRPPGLGGHKTLPTSALEGILYFISPLKKSRYYDNFLGITFSYGAPCMPSHFLKKGTPRCKNRLFKLLLG